MIQLGDRVADEVTGFRGIVEARCEYLTGCARLLVQPTLDEKGAWTEARWIDEPRLQLLYGSPRFVLSVDKES